MAQAEAKPKTELKKIEKKAVIRVNLMADKCVGFPDGVEVIGRSPYPGRK